MTKHCNKCKYTILLVALLLVLPAMASSAQHQLRLTTAVQHSGAIHIDGKLDEPAWDRAPSIENLVMIVPEEGGEPTGQTIVRVLVTSPPGVLMRRTSASA